MRGWTALLLAVVGATSLLAQAPGPAAALDSGTVVRLYWPAGNEKARLLAPFGRDSALVRYCRYPSPLCGDSALNPTRARPARDLVRIEVRQGSRTGRGALIGAGVGALGGLAVLLGRGLSDEPAWSTGRQVLTLAGAAGIWSLFGALIGSASDDWAPVP